MIALTFTSYVREESAKYEILNCARKGWTVRVHAIMLNANGNNSGASGATTTGTATVKQKEEPLVAVERNKTHHLNNAHKTNSS